MSAGDVGIVLIGRNEGARLRGALAALKGETARLVYVDSGSSDDSVAEAGRAGAHVVQLDDHRPHTAARARNAGFAALGPDHPEFVQFVDGDCMIEPGWIMTARTALKAHSDWGLVTGWRSEVAPEASLYNALCDWEWHRPEGPITACGGDMMVRARAFREAGGFDERVIAAEDDEFCQRLAAAGWQMHRLPVAMTRHDAAMTRLSQWWRRAVRSGHGFAQVGALHPGYFADEQRRVALFGMVLPLLAVYALMVEPWLLAPIGLAYAVSYWRGVQALRRDGLDWLLALRLGLLLTLSKLPNAQGMLTYAWRRWRGAGMTLIEYK